MCALCEPPDPLQAGQVAVHPAPSGRGGLVCARCGAETPQLFYDERDLPVCAGSAEEPHGRMELRQ